LGQIILALRQTSTTWVNYYVKPAGILKLNRSYAERSLLIKKIWDRTTRMSRSG